jgi:hypothetical protein
MSYLIKVIILVVNFTLTYMVANIVANKLSGRVVGIGQLNEFKRFLIINGRLVYYVHFYVCGFELLEGLFRIHVIDKDIIVR